MSTDPAEFVLPTSCDACLGTGEGRELVNDDGTFSVRPCVCPKCDGHGLYDLLGDRQWETIRCEPRHKDLYFIDDSSWEEWVNDSLNDLRKLRVSDEKEPSHWLYDLSWS